MNIKLEVQHSEETVDVIKQKIKEFAEVRQIILKTRGKSMIKLMPVKDTLSLTPDSRLSGLLHSYFCMAKVYDLSRKVFYESKILHDEVVVDGVGVRSSYFKDFGILYFFDEPVEIDYTQSILVKRL